MKVKNVQYPEMRAHQWGSRLILIPESEFLATVGGYLAKLIDGNNEEVACRTMVTLLHSYILKKHPREIKNIENSRMYRKFIRKYGAFIKKHSQDRHSELRMPYPNPAEVKR